MNFNIRNKAFWYIDRLKGGKIIRNFKEIKEINESKHYDLIKSYQHNKLKNILEYAKSNVSFYNSIKGVDLESFPVVNKMDYKKNINQFISKKFNKENLIAVTTSGSTGTPFVSYQDKNKKLRNTADTIYFSGKAGYMLGEPIFYLKIWNKLNKKGYLLQKKENIYPIDVRNLSDHNLKKIINKIIRMHVSGCITGYASAIEVIANYIVKNNIDMNGKIHCIVTMSEALDENVKKLVEKAFKSSTFSRYSNVENGILAQQISESKKFKLNIASYFFEILALNSDKPVADGEIGRIVVTDFFNMAMPFIRYDTGDLGVKERKTNSEGTHGFLTKIEGRKMDAIYNTKGELVSSFIITNGMWKYNELQQYQFIQEGINKYRFKLNTVVPFKRKEELINDFKLILGSDAIIEIEMVNEIPLLNSGKRKKVMNLLNSKI